ncbi:MAG: universal stress protein [Acidobacteria bacterium]|nr:universal stress protein [Acidobacteriota bacterium]
MYRKIYVPLDNSDHSNACVELAIALAKQYGSQVVGSHVYAAKMHDYRFKQMEFTLPEEYQDEKELERQRKIHDSLISMGLKLISDSYLDVMVRRCQEEGLPFQGKTFDGKNYQLLVEDIQNSDYDLVVMGALGIGAVKDSLLGSVCERVVRRVKVDTLVVKNTQPLAEHNGSCILVAVDGSPQSFAGLKTALELGKHWNRPVEAVGVYDPYLHYAMFNSIVGVLSDQASKVFRFKEQEKLHEEIIDTGLAKIYQSHLEVAQRVAQDDGVALKVTLMDGKAFDKILLHARRTQPWLLVVGRIGVHSDANMDIGSNAENLLRLAPCNVLLSSRTYVPALDYKAETSIAWTEEANARMKRVPSFVRGVARTAILRFAIERGHSIISSSVIDDALSTILPEPALKAMGIAAKKVALEKAREMEVTTYVCGQCGYTAREQCPVQCPVCGSSSERFQMLDKSMIETLAAQEGETTEEQTFDGVALKWTEEAKKSLWILKDAYLRRRAKARIEKTARVQKIGTITRDFVLPIIRETAGILSKLEDGSPGDGHLTWTDEAAARLDKVPSGFMRDMTRDRIEQIAREKGATAIDLALVEEGIEQGKKMMTEMISNYAQGGQAQEQIHQAASRGVPNEIENLETDY